MNNIYKVIWSKAKNCYVVASEIARSHTKSASGSEKIGGVTRRSLLASLMALSLLCGGLGVAEASVHVDETGGLHEVLTKQEVTEELGKVSTELDKKVSKEVAELKYAKASDVATNTKDIATNKENISELNGKLTNLTTVVDGKANEVDVNAQLANKADKTALDNKANKATTLDGYGITDAYTKTDANDKFATSDALTTAKTDLEGKITTAKNELDGKIAANTTKIDANKTAIDDLKTKATAADTTLTGLSERMTTAENNITNLKDADVRLEGKIDQNANDITGLRDKDVELSGNIGANKTAIDQNKTDITQNKNDIANINGKLTTAEGNIKTNTDNINALDKKVGTINNGTYLDGTASVADNLGKLDAGLKQEVADRKAADTALSGRIDANANTIAKVNQELVNTNNHFNTELRKTNDHFNAELRKTNAALQEEGKARAEADAKINTKIGNIDDTRTEYVKNANSISQNLTTLDEKLQATNDRTGGIKRNTEDTQTTIEDKVTVDKDGNVGGVKGLSAETINTTGDAAISGKLNVTGASDLKGDVTLGTPNGTNTVTVNGTANFHEAVNMDKGLNVTNGETNLKKTTVDGDLKVTGTITTDKMVFGDKATNNYTEIDKGHITSKNDALAGDATKKSSSMELDHSKLEVGVTDKDSNGHLTMTADQTSIKNSDLDGKNYSEIVADKDSVTTTVKDEKGNTTSTKSSATEIRNYAKDAAGNKTINVQTATQNKSWAKDKDGNESSIVQTGKDITNTAQNGTITNDANHIVNKANTIDTTVTGKATESYGELDTTVKGNQTTTVEGNVKEDYKHDLTTTVGGNELHEVTGTKTENVTGKVTENYNGGQETNVTGNQDIHVTKNQTNKIDGDQVNIIGGSQTTTATDINRNASSGMIDTIDNDYGTNTETKVAGKTTTDVSIKGTGEKGQYIRGANESRDYLIKGTLKNSETKTVDATSTEITDGKGKTSATIQDVNNLAGSVTNGTETGVSGIHANDNSVSIDSIVTDGNKYSVINQKKGSIQSTVVDGTNSTVILQDKDNVTIASSKGMVAIGGKDIVNNAQNTITNTAGTSITNQVKDSKVTTDANGTTFENNTPAVSDGGATMTKINGNHINTGRVDANELGVSDKDDQGNTADFSVKAGGGVKASASNGTTTGSLDVTGDKVESSVKDGDNETSIKQTATDITNTAKDGTIKNDAKDIMNEASKSITNKVGDNTSETMKDGEITTSIKDGAKKNTVISTADGTSFFNSEAWEPVTGASGLGTAKNTTIKGNTITTGKVTMDYADVMKDLGVRGNANITGTTTTKTLNVTENATVGGKLDVTGKATFSDDVDIANNLSVGKAVTAKSYKVGEKTYIDENGIHANGQKITDVADGSISEGSKDAVNGGQLYNVKNDLEGKVNKVGANAAAMANLHPMEFDPDSKWNIAAAIGNYSSETAAALGAFYRPNDDVMVNLSTAFGTGENMVGGGVSVRLGKGGNKLSREESNALKDQVNDLTARMDALLSVLNPNMSKDFPDVPENHWAYEAVSRLAGNDIVQGYPDGEFHGERTMTRYEMAEIIYNALSRGAEAEKELVEEFKPELQAMAASEKATAERAEG